MPLLLDKSLSPEHSYRVGRDLKELAIGAPTLWRRLCLNSSCEPLIQASISRPSYLDQIKLLACNRAQSGGQVFLATHNLDLFQGSQIRLLIKLIEQSADALSLDQLIQIANPGIANYRQPAGEVLRNLSRR